MEKSNYHSNADHHKRHMKQSVEKRAFLCAFIISFTVCTLFLGWRLASVLEATQIPPIPATHTGSSTDVVENLEENALATAKEQGDEQEWSLILVNRQNPIPAQYDVELEQLSNGERIDIRISPYLQDLFDAARTDGVYPIVAS
ncbi:TPA: M15 family metallopeptidase, partial [Enterococcus faecium]|nr:M15 family metallopeptidase [Enterococcus faecium]HAR0962915.1 M15 family metallopeptidase [Enterococcus faecium]